MRRSTILLTLLVLVMLGLALAARWRRPLEVHSLSLQSLSHRIDLNTADIAALGLLPGVGPNIAQRIIDYRNAHGHFTKVDDLQNISGIGERTVERIRPYVTCGMK